MWSILQIPGRVHWHIYSMSVFMPTLPSCYCLEPQLRVKRHYSLMARTGAPDWYLRQLIPPSVGVIFSRNRSHQRHRNIYKSPARLKLNYTAVCGFTWTGSRTNKALLPIRQQRIPRLYAVSMQGTFRSTGPWFWKVSLRHVTSTFGASNGADMDRLGVH
jgi:hypothetical protein